MNMHKTNIAQDISPRPTGTVYFCRTTSSWLILSSHRIECISPSTHKDWGAAWAPPAPRWGCKNSEFFPFCRFWTSLSTPVFDLVDEFAGPVCPDFGSNTWFKCFKKRDECFGIGLAGGGLDVPELFHKRKYTHIVRLFERIHGVKRTLTSRCGLLVLEQEHLQPRQWEKR